METNFFIKALPIFSELPKQDSQTILNALKIKTYQKKELIFIHGDPADRFVIVFDGFIKLFRSTMEGNEAVIAIFSRGDCFGEAVLVENALYPHSAQAMVETKVIECPAAVLRDTALNNRSFMLKVMHSMTERIERLNLENEHLAVMSAKQRIACLIYQMYLSQHKPNHRDNKQFSIPYNKHIAATRLGMTAETFSRGLKDLQSINVNIHNNEVKIDNPEKLEKICCVNCSASPLDCPLARSPINEFQIIHSPKT